MSTPPAFGGALPARRAPLAETLVVVLAGLLAVAAGVAVAHDARIGVAALLALAYAGLAVRDPALALALWIPAFSASFYPVGNALLRVGFPVALLAILVVHLRSGGVAAAIWRHPAWLGLSVVLLGWAVGSIVWADAPAPAATESVRAALAVFAGVVIVWVVRSPRDVVLVVLALVAGPVLSAAVGIVGGAAVEAFAGGATGGRLAGGAGDANQLAAGLVPAVALCLGLLGMRGARVARGTALVALPVAVVAIALTESRGGAIALAAVVVLGTLLLPGVRRWILATAGVGALVLAASPGVLGRLSSLDGDGTGRDDLWRVATQMTLDHPWGVGLNNFRSQSAAYALDPGAIEHLSQVVGRPVVVHNTYLQLAAELGVVGLLLFLAVVAAAVAAAWRAARVFAATGRPGLATLARSAIVAQASFLVAALFVSFGFSYRMWSLLALGPALLTAARAPSTRG